MDNNINAPQLENAARVAAQISSFSFALALAAENSGCSSEILMPALQLLFEIAHEHEQELLKINDSI